jgi:hypothetical protein
MKIFYMILIICLSPAGLAAQTEFPAGADRLAKQDPQDQTAAAEMNGFPSPKKVIMLKDTLGLTKGQVKKISEIMENLSVSAGVMEQEIAEAEEDLNKLFRSEKISEKLLRIKLERIGKLKADLRFVNLQVCLQTRQLLSVSQMELFKEIDKSESKQ